MIPREIAIYDANGDRQDAAWVAAKYGAVAVERATVPKGAPVFRVVEIREKVGPATLIAKTVDPEGQPKAGIRMIRYWPGAPQLPFWDPPPERWRDWGVHGKTNAEGDIGYGMGQGDYYDPAKEAGASAIWSGEPGHHSDLISGLGMLPGTNHAHLDTVFQLAEGSGNGGNGGGGGGFWAEVGAAVAEIAAGVDRLGAALASLGEE